MFCKKVLNYFEGYDVFFVIKYFFRYLCNRLLLVKFVNVILSKIVVIIELINLNLFGIFVILYVVYN